MWPEILPFSSGAWPGPYSAGGFVDRRSHQLMDVTLRSLRPGAPNSWRRVPGAESGLRQGPSHRPTCRHRKWCSLQIPGLFASSAAFESLEGSRAILREARSGSAAAVPAPQPKPPTVRGWRQHRSGWCGAASHPGGCQPVIDRIAQNPEHAEVQARCSAQGATSHLRGQTPAGPPTLAARTMQKRSGRRCQQWHLDVFPADGFVERGMRSLRNGLGRNAHLYAGGFVILHWM